jgi:hypothetical protein
MDTQRFFFSIHLLSVHFGADPVAPEPEGSSPYSQVSVTLKA